jgi:type VI protein secretion system component VasK
VPFKITLKQREGVSQVRFQLGNREVKHNERPDNQFDFTWSETEPSNAKISILVGGKEDESLIRFKDDWALLRLVAAGNPQPRGEDSFVCSWKIPVDRLGTTTAFYADAILEALDKVNPFQKDFFLKFDVPEKVGP